MFHSEKMRQFREEVIKMANNQIHDDVNAKLKVSFLESLMT